MHVQASICRSTGYSEAFQEQGAEVACCALTHRPHAVQLTATGQDAKKPSNVLKALSAQRVELEGQLIASVVSTPNFVEVTINIGNIRCRVANASWSEDCFGHFPSALSLTVIPLTATALFSVNKSSTNKAFKINMVEQTQVALGIGISTQVSAVLRPPVWFVINYTHTCGFWWYHVHCSQPILNSYSSNLEQLHPGHANA